MHTHTFDLGVRSADALYDCSEFGHFVITLICRKRGMTRITFVCFNMFLVTLACVLLEIVFIRVCIVAFVTF